MFSGVPNGLLRLSPPQVHAAVHNSGVTKLNPAGTAVLYSTYLGGSGDDGGADITVDSQGNAYVVGSTSSSDFPTVQAFQPSHSGGSEVLRADAFIAKIDPTGSQLVYSTYLGGSGDDLGIGVAVDSANSAYVTGETVSLDFPVMNAMQPAPRGLTDGFVVKLNPSGSELVYGTYLGGNGTDGIHAIAVDMSGSAFLTGATESTDFPTVNGFQQANAGSGDGFVTKVDPTGALLNYSTYIGGESDDTGSDIAVDSEGNAYVAGFTGSSGFPVVNAAQPEFGNTDLLGFDAFAAKITADGSALAYSTFLGGSEIDLGFGIAVDSQGNAYVTGETDSVDFPISDAVQPLPGGSPRWVCCKGESRRFGLRVRHVSGRQLSRFGIRGGFGRLRCGLCNRHPPVRRFSGQLRRLSSEQRRGFGRSDHEDRAWDASGRRRHCLGREL